SNLRGSTREITAYCGLLVGAQRSHWTPGVFTRVIIASSTLQWGTVGAAVIVTYFTPSTQRIGCRSFSSLIYGGISTLIWMMPLMSSVLARAHYSAAYSHRATLSARVALILSHWLRTVGHRKFHPGGPGVYFPVFQLLRYVLLFIQRTW
ncbi:hypothetical protein M405DRAFT_740536, partial [Rhizopogon salebrosus TDB-379]